MDSAGALGGHRVWATIGRAIRCSSGSKRSRSTDYSELSRMRPSAFHSPSLAREGNDSVAMGSSGRPPTHLQTKANSSKRRCTRCRSKMSVRCIFEHAKGCSKYPSRHSSSLSSMAASLDRRVAISASTFCRSIRISVAPAASFRVAKASFRSPEKQLALANRCQSQC